MGQALRRAVTPERIDGAIRFFLYALIFWLPYSPAVIEICVVVSLLLWVIKKIASQNAVWHREDLFFRQKIVECLKGFRLVPSCLNGPIAFFLVVCILSVISSIFFAIAARNFLTKTLEWFIVYFLVIEVFREKKHITIAFGVWIFTALSTVLDSFVQFYFTHKDIFLGHVIEPGARATAGFKVPNGLGAYLALLIPFLFAMSFLKGKKLWYRSFTVLIFCLSLWSLVITFSRGATLGVGIGALFFIWVFFAGKIRHSFILGSLVVLGLVGICGLLTSKGYIGTGPLTRNNTVQWRLNIWKDSLEMIKDRPVLGHGINTFMKVFESYRMDVGTNPTYAHNCYIQLAAETGIAGLFGFLWIIGKLFQKSLLNLRRMANNKNVTILSIGLLSGILSFLVHSFFDTNFYTLQLSVYLWLMIGILVSLNKIYIEPAVS